MTNEQVVKGQDVRVVRGRKIPLGVTGRVFWVGGPYFYTAWQNRHGGSGSYRVGITTAAGETFFVDVKNVEPVDLGQEQAQYEDDKAAYEAERPRNLG